MMPTDYEYAIKKFLPAFRSSAAKIMVNEHRLTEQKAASMLGTTQAAVSKYLKENSGKYNGINIDSRIVKEFAENMIANKIENGQKAMCKMCQMNNKFDCAFMVK